MRETKGCIDLTATQIFLFLRHYHLIFDQWWSIAPRHRVILLLGWVPIYWLFFQASAILVHIKRTEQPTTQFTITERPRGTTKNYDGNSDHFQELMNNLSNKTLSIQAGISRINQLYKESIFVPTLRTITERPQIFTRPPVVYRNQGQFLR